MKDRKEGIEVRKECHELFGLHRVRRFRPLCIRRLYKSFDELDCLVPGALLFFILV